MATDADIDDTDRQLLNALLEDGRASARELSQETGIATAVVTQRLRDLEEREVIEGYRPEIDYAAAGYDVTAVFHLEVDGAGLSTVVDDLESETRMIDVYEVTGDYDVIAVGKFADTDEMNAQIKRILTHEDVRAASTSVVLEVASEHDPVSLAAPE